MLEHATLLGSRRVSADAVEWDLLVPASLACFPEHFPDHPVLPGVIQLGWAISACQREFGITRPLRKMNGLKFLYPIQPDTRLSLALLRKSASQVAFSFRDDLREYSCGKLSFADEG